MRKVVTNRGFCFEPSYRLLMPLPERAYQILRDGMVCMTYIYFSNLFVRLATEEERLDIEKVVYINAAVVEGLTLSLDALCPLRDPEGIITDGVHLWRISLFNQSEAFYYHILDGGRPVVSGVAGNTRRKIIRELHRDAILDLFGDFGRDIIPFLEETAVLRINAERSIGRQ